MLDDKYFYSIRHSVIPAGGRGTRFLPLTKAIPKEMLPLVRRPTIDYVVREAILAELDDCLIISSSGKDSIINYFDANAELENHLQKNGSLSDLNRITYFRGRVQPFFVRQGELRGLGHAILQARGHVGDNPFAVLLPDDILDPSSTLMQRMCMLQALLGGSVVALLKVNPTEASAYGSVKVKDLDSNLSASQPDDQFPIDPSELGKVMQITDLIEKPSREQILSEYAVVGRYVLHPAVFPLLEEMVPLDTDEIQLTDALRKLAVLPRQDGGGLWGLVLEEKRYDTGTPLGYLKANLEFCLQDKLLGRELKHYLIHLLRDTIW